MRFLLTYLVLALPGATCLLLHVPRELDTMLSIAQYSMGTILEDSQSEGCSLIVITNENTSSNSVSKFSSSFGGYVGYTSLDIGSNPTATEISRAMVDIDQVRRSRGCSTVIVISEEEDFLTTVISNLFNSNILPWTSRLMVVTRILPAFVSFDLQTILSQVNGMILVVLHNSSSSSPERCDTYLYIPHSLRRVHVTSWNRQKGLTYHSQQGAFPNKFKRFTDGGKLVVAGISYFPHTTLRVTSNEMTGHKRLSILGPTMEIIKIVAHKVNFTYTLTTNPEKSFGYLLPNGSWNGLVSMILRKDVDIIVGPLAVTYHRWKVIEYTNPLFFDYVNIQGKRGIAEVDAWGFAIPLAPLVWASIALIFIAILLTSSLLANISVFSSKSSRDSSVYHRILLQQDIRDVHIKWWERMLVGGWMLTALVVVKSYSGNLMSQLAVRHISQPYQSLRVVLDTPKIKMIWVADTALVQYFKGASSGILHEVAESEGRGQIKYIKSEEFMTSVNDLVSQGDHVSLNPHLSARLFFTQTFTDRGRCKFYLSRGRYLSFTTAMALRKGSPLLPAVNDGIRAAIEGGLYNYWLEKILPIAPGCKNPPTKITVKSSLSLSNLWGMFIVLICGLALSSLVFLYEVGRSVIPLPAS